MTEFKLFKVNNVYILKVNDIEIESLQNSLMTEDEIVEYFLNSITSYQNLKPFLTVTF